MRMTSVVHCILPFAALSLPFSLNAEAATNCGSPGPNQAIIWQHYDYSGNCDILGIGSYPTSAIFGMSVGNDGVSSVSVGSNVKITLYEHGLPGTSPVGNWLPVIATRTVWPEFNDVTSAIRVESRIGCPNPGPNQVVVWEHSNFGGHCDVIDRDYPVTWSNIFGLSVGNDTISSTKCGSSSGVLLWEHGSINGASFVGPQACSINALSAWSFDNTASSVFVSTPCHRHDPSATCGANGFCELPNSGGGIGSCAATDGVCSVKPTTCEQVTAPVCGCDGKTYANDCERRAAGMPKWNDGPCSNPSQSCPGAIPTPLTSCTPSNMYCTYLSNNPDCVERFWCSNGSWSAPVTLCGY